MTANQKVTGRASSIPGGLAIGGFMSLIITIIGAMIAAWLIGNERVQEQHIGYCSMLILLASSFIGAWIAASKIKHRRLYICILSGMIYYGMLLTITALFFGGRYQAMGVTAAVVLAGCMSAALTGQRGEKGRVRRRRKAAHR